MRKESYKALIEERDSIIVCVFMGTNMIIYFHINIRHNVFKAITNFRFNITSFP